MDFRFNGNKPKKVIFDGHNLKQIDVVKNGARATVWKSETDVLPMFSASDYYRPSGAYRQVTKNSDNTLLLSTSSNTSRNIWTSAVDFSEYSKLTINYTVTTSNKSSGYDAKRYFVIMANGTNTYTADFSTRTDIYTPSSPRTSFYKIYPSGDGSAARPVVIDVGTYTQEIDISGWTGSLKLGLATVCGSSNNLTLTVNSLVLE